MIIGFTVGVWDLFHKGHINFLKQAKKACDYLHVGIMNDYWVRVQKGHERPAESLQKRVEILRSSGLCDNIVTLDTLDMRPYLQMANIWFKSPGQCNMLPVEYENTVYIERMPGISTSKLINGD